MGYLYTTFRTLFPLKTTVIAISNQATIKTFPDLSVLDEDDRDSLYSMYSLPELMAMRKKTSKLLSKMERTDLPSLKKHLDTFDAVMKVRIAAEALDNDGNRLDNLFNGFVLHTPSPVVVSTSTVTTLVSPSCSRILPIGIHRHPCALPPVLQALNKPLLAEYTTKIIKRIYSSNQY